MKKMLAVLGIAIVMICNVITTSVSAVCEMTINPDNYNECVENESRNDRDLINNYLSTVNHKRYDNVRFWINEDGNLAYITYTDENTAIGSGWVSYSYANSLMNK